MELGENSKNACFAFRAWESRGGGVELRFIPVMVLGTPLGAMHWEQPFNTARFDLKTKQNKTK